MSTEAGGYSEQEFSKLLKVLDRHDPVEAIMRLETQDWETATGLATEDLGRLEYLSRQVGLDKMSYHAWSDKNDTWYNIAVFHSPAGEDGAWHHVVVNEQTLDPTDGMINLTYWEFTYNPSTDDLAFATDTARGDAIYGWAMGDYDTCALLRTTSETVDIIRGHENELPYVDPDDRPDAITERQALQKLAGYLSEISTGKYHQPHVVGELK